jgi:hypothetical protein
VLLELRRTVAPSLLLTSCLLPSVAGCSNGKASATESTVDTTTAALGAPKVQLVAWGEGPAELGLRAAVPERAAFGAPAVAVSARGEVFVLDAVKQRIVRVGREVSAVATVPRDADDLAVSADGAFAVRRAMSPKILVLDPAGQRIGEVDAQGLGDVDSLALGASRRVVVRTAFQETFQLGSPSAPQLGEAIARSRKVGADLLANGDGVVVLAHDGAAELRVVAQAQGEEGHAEARATWPLGRATSAHVVGLSGHVACLRLEHVDTASSGPLSVTREALCLDTASGATVLRADLDAPGLYVPRRELTFASGRLVFAHPEKEGLRVTTWVVPTSVAGGVR